MNIENIQPDLPDIVVEKKTRTHAEMLRSASTWEMAVLLSRADESMPYMDWLKWLTEEETA